MRQAPGTRPDDSAWDVDLGQLPELAPGRKAALEEVLSQLVQVLFEAAHEDRASARELEVRGKAAVDTLRLVVEGGPERLERLIDVLDSPTAEEGENLAEEDAEVRARLRLHILYRRVIRDSFSVAELADQMRLSRQRLKQLRDQDRLFGIEVPFHKGLLYPRWQFDRLTGKPRPELPGLIAAARGAGLDALGFHLLMTSADVGAGMAPLDLLEAGEEDRVLEIIGATDR